MAGNSQESKRLKRSHAVDRLSSLPDNMLHHIISFLDSKSAVRTSLLARRWRCLWKHVPVLNFILKSFPNLSSFTKHINRVLSFRFHQIPVSSITFDMCGDKWGGAMKTFEKIMKYADSHGGAGLHYLSIIDDKLQFNIRDVANVITASHHHESLETLKLVKCSLQHKELDSRFNLLTSLNLRYCTLEPYPAGELFDPFGNLPCLNHLKLIACNVLRRGSTGFIISGLHLLDLEVQFSSFVNEVLAPKLKYLYWWGGVDPCLPKLNLPALDHANIRLGWHIPYQKAAWEEMSHAFMNFLCGLRNAEYLQLRFDMASYCYYHGEQDYFPLHTIKALVGPEAPPFSRLNTLKLQCAGQQKLPSVCYEVIRYFFEGSLSTEAKHLQLELVNEK